MSRHLKLCALLFLSFAAIYLFLAAGYIDTIDADASIATSVSLLEHGSFAVPSAKVDRMVFTQGRGGSYYTKLGLIHPLLYLPFVAVGKLAARITSAPKKLCVIFFCSLLNPILTALILTLLFWHCLKEGMESRHAFWLAFTLGFATLLFPYSKSAQREPFEALCLLSTYLFTRRATREEEPLFFLFVGVSAALVILCKPVLFLLCLPALWLCLKRKKIPLVIRTLTPIAIALTLQLGYSYWAFGSPWSGGYSHAVTHLGSCWSTPFGKGLYLQLLSPRSGILLYSPILLLTPLCLFHLWRIQKFDGFQLALVAAFFLQAAIHAKWWTPTGGEALGPRFLVAALPLLFLLPDPSFPRLLMERFRAPTVMFLIFCFAWQLPQTLVKPQEYWTLQQRAGSHLTTPPWLADFHFLIHKGEGLPERYRPSEFGAKTSPPIDLTDLRSFRGVNVWWTHARFISQSMKRRPRAILSE